MRGSYHDIGTQGTVYRWLWFSKVFHPLAAATSNVNVIPEHASQETTRKVPRLKEIIMQGKLIVTDGESVKMLRGFKRDGSPVYGSFSGVIGVAGNQNVGKSVTITVLSIIAIMQRTIGALFLILWKGPA
jgi:hypothetical protein